MERPWVRRNNENRVEGLALAGILWHRLNSTWDCEVNENVTQEFLGH